MSPNRRNITILFFTLIVVMLGFGMIIPIMPFYITKLGASGTALGVLMAIYGAMQFIFAPIWGQLSDRYGRKRIMLLGIFGNAVAQLLFGLSTQLWMLFAARALSGVLSSATLPTAMAYISDSTSDDQRGGGMGMIGAAMGVGMVIGPGLGGWLGGENLSIPFFMASALSVLALVLVALLLPESLPPENRSVETNKVSGPNLRALWQALFGPIGFLLFMALLLSFGLTNFESIFGLYAADRYGYTPAQVGTILTVIGLISAVVQGALTGPMIKRWGEAWIIRASLLSSVFGFLLLTQARTFPQVMAVVSYYIISNAMLNPSVASLISKRTVGGLGSAMGMNNAFLSLGRVAGPLWAGMVYDIHYNYPYLTGALIFLVGFGLSLPFLSTKRETKVTPAG